MSFIPSSLQRLIGQGVFTLVGKESEAIEPISEVHIRSYLMKTKAKMEHLKSLPLHLEGLSVIDVGAGIGDFAEFYIDRGCDVTVSDSRQENIDVVKKRFPGVNTRVIDLERDTD